MKTIILHEETNELIAVTEAVPVRNDYESMRDKIQMHAVNTYCALIGTDRAAAEKSFFDEHKKIAL